MQMATESQQNAPTFFTGFLKIYSNAQKVRKRQATHAHAYIDILQ